MRTYLQYVCRLGRIDIVLGHYANGQFSPFELAEPMTLDAMLVPASLFVILECLIGAQTGAMGEIAATHVYMYMYVYVCTLILCARDPPLHTFCLLSVLSPHPPEGDQLTNDRPTPTCTQADYGVQFRREWFVWAEIRIRWLVLAYLEAISASSSGLPSVVYPFLDANGGYWCFCVSLYVTRVHPFIDPFNSMPAFFSPSNQIYVRRRTRHAI